ncbi:MAG: histidine phosphatase family protein [Bacteroidales bacterium]|nr:histidine phosphatase family protein [Bacteroidales bacterium]
MESYDKEILGGNSMKILFIRHGESLANAKIVKASDPDYLNGLTLNGIEQIKVAANSVTANINAIYASPYNRTIITAQTFIETRGDKLEILADDRLREIDYGIHGDNKSHPEMVEVAKRQVAGDYEVRFGRTGENKREIITRLFGFMIDMFNTNKENEIIVAISHGRVISILDFEFGTVTGIQKEHASTTNAEIKEIELNADNVAKITEYLKRLNADEIERRCQLIKDNSKDNDSLRPHLLEMAARTIDDIDASYNVLEYLVTGLYKSDIDPVKITMSPGLLDKSDIILMAVFKYADNFIKHFLNHYKNIGISKFVFIDNNSSDRSVELINEFAQNEKVEIDIWGTKDVFNSIKSMGWKRRLISYYGLNRWYLVLDIDELFVFDGSDVNKFVKSLEALDCQAAGSVMIDMYTKRPLSQVDQIVSENIIKEYRYFDKGPYSSNRNKKYGRRVFGGLRQRVFFITPSLQKFPLIYVKEDTIGLNPHFWYPYSINMNVKFASALLHYKFLPHDIEKYDARAKSGVYYNDSYEYKTYIVRITKTPDLAFYDPKTSQEFENFDSVKNILG